MKKKDIYTLIALITLTILTALISNKFEQPKSLLILVLFLSILKFILVTFGFMELKKANPFWKIIVITYLLVFGVIISILK